MRKIFVLALGIALIVPSPAIANPGFYASPIFGVTSSADDAMLVADAGQGIVRVTGYGSAQQASLFAPLPGITDVDETADGGMWAIRGGGGPRNLGCLTAFNHGANQAGLQKSKCAASGALFHVTAGGDVRRVADLAQFEKVYNPHPAAVDSNPFDVEDLGGGIALVADAGGNTLLRVEGPRVELVAVLPDQLVSTENIKTLVGCPTPLVPDFAFVCGLPAMIPAEAVATSIAIGPDGAYYVGELTGFPAPVGFSRVWRIDPTARSVQCGASPLCTVAVGGLTSIIDLQFGPDGRLYVAQIEDKSFGAIELLGLGIPIELAGGSVHACTLAGACETIATGLPILTSITFRGDDSLWGATNALIPGVADVVQLIAAP
jgi:hypothetical protein